MPIVGPMADEGLAGPQSADCLGQTRSCFKITAQETGVAFELGSIG